MMGFHGVCNQSKKEEEELLLSELSEHSASDQGSVPDGLRTPTIRSRTSIHTLITLAALLIGMAIISTFVKWYLIPQTKMSASASQRGEYMLDPVWNFNDEPQRREFHWTITDLESNPDGIFRPMMVINGQFPGPLIESNEGDTIVVHVHNQATNATAIHWHGLYQNGTNWFDGTVGITQCPIPTGASLTYEFNTKGQSGTYWYHGHRGVQASDGLLGPLIIHSTDEKTLQQLEYATDRVIMVQDHYYNTSSELVMDYLKNDMKNAEPVPDGALINGHNIRNCNTVPGRKCDASNASLAIFNLERGKRHRLRFTNVGAFAEFQIQIDEHEFAVTEVDGTDVVPAYFHRLNILPGQRYSIIVNTNIETGNSYWLRARMLTNCFAEENEEMEPEVRAIIQYSDTPIIPATLPTSRDWPEIDEIRCQDMNTSALHPVVPIAAPSVADATVHLRMSLETGDWKLSRGFFNSTTWYAPFNTSTLWEFASGIASQNVSFTSTLSDFPTAGLNTHSFNPATQLTYQTTQTRTLDILVSSYDDGAHPLHLHGQKFWVLASGKGEPPANLTDGLDLSNPLRRDTATIGAYEWILLRFVADNPGMWAFHCHMAWHVEAGLMMQFLVRAEIVSRWKVPEEVEGLCATEGLERGARPDDSIWFGPPKEDGDVI